MSDDLGVILPFSFDTSATPGQLADVEARSAASAEKITEAVKQHGKQRADTERESVAAAFAGSRAETEKGLAGIGDRLNEFRKEERQKARSNRFWVSEISEVLPEQAGIAGKAITALAFATSGLSLAFGAAKIAATYLYESYAVMKERTEGVEKAHSKFASVATAELQAMATQADEVSSKTGRKWAEVFEEMAKNAQESGDRVKAVWDALAESQRNLGKSEIDLARDKTRAEIMGNLAEAIKRQAEMQERFNAARAAAPTEIDAGDGGIIGVDPASNPRVREANKLLEEQRARVAAIQQQLRENEGRGDKLAASAAALAEEKATAAAQTAWAKQDAADRAKAEQDAEAFRAKVADEGRSEREKIEFEYQQNSAKYANAGRATLLAVEQHFQRQMTELEQKAADERLKARQEEMTERISLAEKERAYNEKNAQATWDHLSKQLEVEQYYDNLRLLGGDEQRAKELQAVDTHYGDLERLFADNEAMLTRIKEEHAQKRAAIVNGEAKKGENVWGDALKAMGSQMNQAVAQGIGQAYGALLQHSSAYDAAMAEEQKSTKAAADAKVASAQKALAIAQHESAADSANVTKKNAVKTATDNLTAAQKAQAQAALAGASDNAAAIQKFAQDTLAGVAQTAAVKALYELAEGLAMTALAWVEPTMGGSAAGHYAAAAAYGAIAGVAGAGAAVIGQTRGMTVGERQSVAAADTSSSPGSSSSSDASGGAREAGSTGVGGNQGTLIVQFSGQAFMTKAELAAAMGDILDYRKANGWAN